jgi:hypothetical protein
MLNADADLSTVQEKEVHNAQGVYFAMLQNLSYQVHVGFLKRGGLCGQAHKLFGSESRKRVIALR